MVGWQLMAHGTWYDADEAANDFTLKWFFSTMILVSVLVNASIFKRFFLSYENKSEKWYKNLVVINCFYFGIYFYWHFSWGDFDHCSPNNYCEDIILYIMV